MKKILIVLCLATTLGYGQDLALKTVIPFKTQACLATVTQDTIAISCKGKKDTLPLRVFKSSIIISDRDTFLTLLNRTTCIVVKTGTKK